ncbi:YdaS family helix-turn-helix protein [Halopseudomonas aestusnigri]|uniref:transcriptional regulator n=1 Tax=Halopseudomonas aestusnigri TaxID=857252 RepID=UPI0025562FD7|nr:YdaS family helix-turn-helix protein [Halopseudomonas aestusnigri]MDL2200847.1 YdaS family helix-turn-helix protein [Halopseudomonas aestusnigri]
MRTKHTELLDWLKSANDEDVLATGTTRGHLRQISYGYRPASPEVAARLESVTEGRITRKQLRPDDWAVIWPELVAA